LFIDVFERADFIAGFVVTCRCANLDLDFQRMTVELLTVSDLDNTD